MWGILKSATEQATSLVGKVDEIASQGLNSASHFLEKLDGLGNEDDEKADENDTPAEDASSPLPSTSVQSLDSISSHHRQDSRSSSPVPSPIVLDSPAGVQPPLPEADQPVNVDCVNQSGKERSVVSDSHSEPHPTPSKPVELKKYQARIRKLEKEKGDLEEEIGSLQISVASLSRELQETMAASKKDHERELWHKEKAELAALITEQEAKLATDRHEREQVTAQQQLALTLLQDEKVALIHKISRLEEAIALQRGAAQEADELRAQNEAISARCSEVETARDMLKDQLQLVQEQLSAAMHSGHEHSQHLERDRDELNVRVRDQDTALEQINEQLRELQYAYGDLQAECDALRGRLQAQSSELVDSQSSTELFQLELQAVKSERAALEEEHRSIQTWRVEAEQANKDLKELHAVLQAEHALVVEERDRLLQSSPSVEEPSPVAPVKLGKKATAQKKKKAAAAAATAAAAAPTAHSLYSTHVAVDSVDSASPESGRHDETDDAAYGPDGAKHAKEVAELNNRVEELKAEKEKIKLLYSSMLQQNDELLQKQHALEVRHQEMQRQRESMLHELDALRTSRPSETSEAAGAQDVLGGDESAETSGAALALKKRQMEEQLAELEQALEQGDRRPSIDLAPPGLCAEDRLAQLCSLEKEHALLLEKLQDVHANLANAEGRASAAEAQVLDIRALHAATEEEKARTAEALELTALKHADLEAQVRDLVASHKSKVEEHATAIGHLQAQTADQAAKLEAQHTEIEVHLAARKELEQQLTDFKDQYLRVLEDLSLLQGKTDTDSAGVSQHVAVLDAQVILLENLNAQLQGRAVDCEARLSSLVDEKTELERELGLLHDQLCQTSKELELARGEVADRADFIASLEEQIQAAHACLVRRDEELAQAQETLADAQSAHALAQEQWAAARALAERSDSDELSTTRKNFSTLLEENQRLEDHCSAALAQYKKLLDDFSAQQRRAAGLDEDIKRQQGAIRALEDAAEAKEQETQTLKNLLMAKQEEASQKALDVQERTAQAHNAEREAAKLKDKLQAALQAKNELQMEVQRLGEEREHLAAQVALFEKEGGKAQGELTALLRTHETLAERCQALEQSDVQSTQQLRLLAAEHKTLQAQHDAVSAQLASLQDERANTAGLQHSLSELQRAHAKVVANFEEAKVDLRHSDEKIAKQATALAAFEAKKKKDLENLKKQNDTINQLSVKLAGVATLQAEYQSLLARHQALEQEHKAAEETLAELSATCASLQGQLQGSASSAGLVEELGEWRDKAHTLQQEAQKAADELSETQIQLAAKTRGVEELVALVEGLRAQAAQAAAMPAEAQAATMVSAVPAVDAQGAAELLNLRQLLRRQEVQLGDLLAERQDLLAQVESTQQQLAHYFQQAYNSSPSSTTVFHAGAFDVEHGGLQEYEKKDLAGAHPLLIQLWTKFRQHCPGPVMAALPERPPRMSLTTQIAILYGAFLQLVVVYQHYHCL